MKQHSAKYYLGVALTVAPSIASAIIASSMGVLKGHPKMLWVFVALGATTVIAVVLRDRWARDASAKSSAMAEKRLHDAFNRANEEAKKEALEVGRDIIARLTSSSLNEAQQHEVAFIVNAAMNKTHPLKPMSISSVPTVGAPTLTEHPKR